LWRLSVATSLEAEDAVSEWLERMTGLAPCAYTDAETRLTTVSVFAPERPDWSRARRGELAAGLAQLGAAGLEVGSGAITLSRVPRQDWAESWKRHFPPLALGRALLLKPSWSRRRPRKGQAVVVLDPGLSFGTGRHPTTEYCLRQLIARRRAGTGQSFLDVGTGSGILAIAAAKLGYAPVAAFDFDPDAVRTAHANASRNGVARRIQFAQRDAARLSRRPKRRFCVVCANLDARLLLAARERLAAQVRPGGVLVLAGVLASEFAAVERAYAALGWRLAGSRAARPWRSGVFGAPPPEARGVRASCP
jgi:ribosomal protein L11 methyltransferase